MPKKGQKMAKFWFSSYNFGTDGPRDLKFGLLASPGDGLPQTRTISDILDFGPCQTRCGIVSTNLNQQLTLSPLLKSIVLSAALMSYLLR